MQELNTRMRTQRFISTVTSSYELSARPTGEQLSASTHTQRPASRNVAVRLVPHPSHVCEADLLTHAFHADDIVDMLDHVASLIV
jgi:hypothetical protein